MRGILLIAALLLVALAGPVQSRAADRDCVSKRLASIFKKLTLTERPPGARVSWSQLSNPFTWPFTIPMEVASPRYRLSTIAHIAATVPGLVATAMVVDQKVHQQMSAHAEDLPGVEYVSQLEQAGLVSTSLTDKVLSKSEAQASYDILLKHGENFRAWAASGGNPPLPKLSEMLSLRIIQNPEELAAINRLAYETARSTICAKDPACRSYPEHLSAQLQENWSKTLRGNPVFSKFSEEKLALLEMAFQPLVKIHGNSDVSILARIMGLGAKTDPLMALHELAHGLDAVSLIFMGNQILNSPKLMTEKMNLWQSWFPSELAGLPSFMFRPDIPLASALINTQFDRLGNGQNTIPLTSELSYWRVIWSDPRFVDLKEALQKGQSNQLEILQLGVARVQAYNEIFKIAPVNSFSSALPALPSLSDQQYCELLPNILIGEPAQRFTQGIEPSRIQGCQIEVAAFLVGMYRKDAGVVARGSGAEHSTYKSELDAVLRHCPTTPRSCKK